MEASHARAADLLRKLEDLEQENTRLKGEIFTLSQRSRGEETEAHYRLLAEHATDIIIRTDLEGLCRYVSPACRTILGVEPEELVSTHFKDNLHPDDLVAETSALEALLSGRLDQKSSTFRMRHKSGHWVWFAAQHRLVRDKQSSPLELISVLRDISDRVHLEDRLRQAQRMEAMGQLTGGIAHDFNNLLTVILSNAEVLVEESTDRDFSSTLARIILEAAERSAELIRHLLAFGRRQALKPVRVSLDHIVRGMMPLLRRTLGEHIELSTKFTHSGLAALTDRALLESAILNLVVNARDAMPQGGHLTIATGERTAQAHEGSLPIGQPVVFVTVSDTGTGMTPDVLGKVFEPFFTTKDVGQGSGLGLAMVYGFAQQTGGFVTIASSPGEGTSVTIVLPGVTGPVIEPEAEGRASTSVTGGNERVLVVEDEPQVLQFVASQLVSLGYGVTAVSNGPDALDILGSDQGFDLLFTDVVMPRGMSGVELSRLARKIKPDLSVLLTSGHSQDIFERHGRPDPDIELLRKPYKRKDLAKAIREALPKARSAHARQGRILVVDDQQHNRDVVERVLAGAGHTVDTAKSGAEAVLAVQGKPYDLVLMDVQMPVMDGDSATRAIRRLDAPARDVPIVAMTGNVQPQQVDSFSAAGMNDYLGKPFKQVELLEKVNAWLRQEPPDEPQRPLPPSPKQMVRNGALADLTELMGEEWVASGLIRLRQEIESTFANEAAALADQRQLARSAHALVSHCALLGFSELSQLCSALEDACRAGRDVRTRFRAARKVARLALEELSATQAVRSGDQRLTH